MIPFLRGMNGRQSLTPGSWSGWGFIQDSRGLIPVLFQLPCSGN